LRNGAARRHALRQGVSKSVQLHHPAIVSWPMKRVLCSYPKWGRSKAVRVHICEPTFSFHKVKNQPLGWQSDALHTIKNSDDLLRDILSDCLKYISSSTVIHFTIPSSV
jgi:hypothetical protein